jgi:hypothetical protein
LGDEGTLAILSLEWVGGFYDGEGAVSIHVRLYSIDIQTSFTQAYHPLLEGVKAYFDKQGILGGHLYREQERRISRLAFVSNEAVLRMLLHLLPVLTVKKLQAQAAIDYLSDKLTGSEFLAIMNQEIDHGRRRGRKHYEELPWSRSLGIEKMRQGAMKLARLTYQAMRSSPNARELERARAVERNCRRGDRTRRNILSLLAKGPLTASEAAGRACITVHRARILMKELYELKLLSRGRTQITAPFEYDLNQAGQDYLSANGTYATNGRRATA